MTKSDKEMKNNSIYQQCIKASYQMPHLRMSFQDWQSCLKVKDTSLEGFELQSKVKIQVRCDLHLNPRLPTFHALKLDICLLCCYFM